MIPCFASHPPLLDGLNALSGIPWNIIHLWPCRKPCLFLFLFFIFIIKWYWIVSGFSTNDIFCMSWVKVPPAVVVKWHWSCVHSYHWMMIYNFVELFCVVVKKNNQCKTTCYHYLSRSHIAIYILAVQFYNIIYVRELQIELQTL